ncbi:MAG: rhodanese-like domain-containing protein [Chloroflexota bacterium]
MVSFYEPLDNDSYKTGFHDARQDHLLLDVRTVEEFEDARIPGAVNIPLDELFERVDEVGALAADRPVVMVCRSGVRSIMGAQILRAGGLNTLKIYNLDDGTLGWAMRGWPLDRRRGLTPNLLHCAAEKSILKHTYHGDCLQPTRWGQSLPALITGIHAGAGPDENWYIGRRARRQQPRARLGQHRASDCVRGT